MVASLNGIIFSQVYGDNSGGSEFDTDGDGTATQEDEFVSFQNTTGSDIDISGWQIWSDMSGTGAPDSPQDGLYHTFPPGTVLRAGKVLHVINEISGSADPGMQEASEGGLESGAGGTNTNFLSEGDGNAASSESLALVDPVSGDYIIFNMSATEPSNIPGQSGFPGTTSAGEDNAVTDSGVEDMNAGSSYQYNAVTDSYDYGAVYIACFAAGTRIAIAGGDVAVEDLEEGDQVVTLDHGLQPVRRVLNRRVNFAGERMSSHKPIEFKPGSLGPDTPRRRLVVSPHHRMLLHCEDLGEILVPAKGLVGRPGVREMIGRRRVTYYHLVFERHEIVAGENCWSESFFPGVLAMRRSDHATRRAITDVFGAARGGPSIALARSALRVGQARKLPAMVGAVQVPDLGAAPFRGAAA